MFNNKYTIEVTIDTEANINIETMIDSKIIILSIPLPPATGAAACSYIPVKD